MNNMGREIMAALKRFETGADGDSLTVGGALVVSGATSANTFTGTVVNATTIDTTNIEVTNIKAKDGTASATIADSTGKITVSGQMTIDGIEVGQGAGNVSTNTAVGVSALAANEAGGTNNTAIGYQALDANTTGDQNTAVGDSALGANSTASNNTAVGYVALAANTTGAVNTAVGGFALATSTTASNNTALGYSALYLNTTGANNTAAGRDALVNNTTASNNTAVGYQAGYTNVTGASNTFLGYQAGYTSASGLNTLIGWKTGFSLTTGTNNTFVGVPGPNDNCGSLITTGSKNTIIGAYSGNQDGLDIRTSSNQVVISDGDGNVRLHFNGNDMASAGVYGNTTATAANVAVLSTGIIRRSTSSLKYKREVQDATHGLAEVLQLRPVTYKGKSEGDGETVFGGLIAEEVHDAGLTEFVQYAADGTPDALAYGNMVSLCVKAIQELSAQVTALQAEVNALKGQ
jgi:hypothetical protein